MEVENKIKQLLEKKFEESDFSECFLVDIKLGINNKLEVFVDSDSGINFVTCTILSRYLESFIDENQWLGEKYVLEVSSPGATKPLKFKRQYLKHIGRELEVSLNNGEKITGELNEIFEDSILLSYIEVVKEGKKKKKVEHKDILKFDDIKHSIVKLRFKKK